MAPLRDSDDVSAHRHYRSRGMEREKSAEQIVSSAIVTTNGEHAMMDVFVRGKLAGRLIIDESDVAAMIGRLLPPGVYADVMQIESQPTGRTEPDASR